MKRESKVYSFKEQLEELQLRRELEEKKRKAGKLKEPELTPKQKELIRLQFEKENAIRTRLRELNTKIVACVSMIRSSAKGDPIIFSTYFKDLLPVLISNFNSPLAAPNVTKVYLELSECVFNGPQRLFGQLLGNVTLRVLKPQCDLDRAWEEEPLAKAVVRTINKLQEACKVPKPLNGPSFCYCFALIKAALLDNIKKDDTLLITGLQIITEHAKMRGESETDLWHPKLLLRHQMLDLLIDIISKFFQIPFNSQN